MATNEARDRGVASDGRAEFATDVVVPPSEPSDEELTLALIEALPDGISVSVQDGWAVLHGTVEWMYQKLADGRTARAMPGVRGVTNLIAVQTELTPAEVTRFIRDAIALNLGDAAKRVDVRVVGSQAILSGMVHSWPERDECGRTAAFAPGITAVDNRITVAYDLPD